VSVITLSEIANEKLAREVAERWHFVSGNFLNEEMPPTPWVCQGLALAPGAVTIVGGAGFGGKTLAMQSLLLAVASGKRIWGQFECKQGRVMHIDYEQGMPLTKRRYQRLARSMRVDLTSLEGILDVTSIAATTLDYDGIERQLMHLLSDVTVAIVDAFRGAFPKATENDSGVRGCLDMLSRVSLRTGCLIIVIAHSKKIQAADDDVRGQLRGSGALFDAAQAVWMLNGCQGKPTRVNHTKERLEGELKETFGLVVEDEVGPFDGDRKWGLNVRYLSPPELQAEYMAGPDHDDNSIALNGARLETLGRSIVDVLSRSADGLVMASIKSMFHGKSADINGVMPLLLQSGDVHCEGKGPTAVYSVTPRSREPGEDG
jgi:hypothetical protein